MVVGVEVGVFAKISDGRVRVRVEHDKYKFFYGGDHRYSLGSRTAGCQANCHQDKVRPARKLYDIVIYKHEFPNSP